jgi:nicotinate-nucleotide pyrophosphorylase (carboxylating)
MKDLRDKIFKTIIHQSVTAVIIADDPGLIAGTQAAGGKAKELGLDVIMMAEEGNTVKEGDEVARISGNPKQIALAEDLLTGFIAKPSGIATATQRFVAEAGETIQIVCGSWKKMPIALKETIRKAIVTGGGYFRISRDPFIYLDKNYIRMFGGIKNSLQAVKDFTGYKKVVQIKGRQKDIAMESLEAAESKADIIYIDSGQPDDIQTVTAILNQKGLRDKVKIAFGNNVKIEDIDRLRNMDVDIIGIGREIVDAPLLDLRMEIVEIKE